MPFLPTTWLPGLAPGISAEQLNRIETGIVDLWKQARNIVVVTVDHTLALVDAGYIVEVNKATAALVTVPPHSDVAFPVGQQIELVAAGVGEVTIAAGAGVTVHTASTLIMRAQWSGATLYQRAVDEWVALGDFLDI